MLKRKSRVSATWHPSPPVSWKVVPAVRLPNETTRDVGNDDRSRYRQNCTVVPSCPSVQGRARGEIAMKVMINEASTLLSVVTTGKATTEGIGSQETSERSDKPSLTLLFRFVMDRQKKEGGQAWSDHCLHLERVLRKQEAPHVHRCTRAQRFRPEHDHWRVADRHESHLGPSRQPSHLDACTPSCRVHTKRGIC